LENGLELIGFFEVVFLSRMHSGKKGKSGSSAPPSKQSPGWVEYKPKEIEEAIVSLSNAGHSASEIGMILRDQYGVPNVKELTGKKIEGILEKHELLPDVPQDLLNLIKKSVALQKHSSENKKDFTAKRGYQLTVSKIRRLVKYYHKKGKLPKEWRYTAEKAALLVK
jgi:small subunit ribosomal protein S15